MYRSEFLTLAWPFFITVRVRRLRLSQVTQGTMTAGGRQALGGEFSAGFRLGTSASPISRPAAVPDPWQVDSGPPVPPRPPISCSPMDLRSDGDCTSVDQSRFFACKRYPGNANMALIQLNQHSTAGALPVAANSCYFLHWVSAGTPAMVQPRQQG